MMMVRLTTWFFVLLASLLLFTHGTLAAMISPTTFDIVVALGAERLLAPVPGAMPQRVWQTEGSGFFYAQLAQNDPDPTKRMYRIFLVTARHVVDMHSKAQRQDQTIPDLSVRLNPKQVGVAAQEFTIPSSGANADLKWFFHPDAGIDVAILPINYNMLQEKGISARYFHDETTANKAKLKETGVAAGDGVFVLGFPMGLSGEKRNYVVLRQGVIARIAEMLDNASTTFTIDCFVFPGNSGGPVVLKPELASIENTKPQKQGFLIGMVLSSKNYVDVAVSRQTGHERVAFEENAGLADILPVDYIDEAVEAWSKTFATKGQP